MQFPVFYSKIKQEMEKGAKVLSRGRRYEEPKLNMKKVFAVFIAFVVFIMFIFVIKGILTKDEQQGGKISSKDYFTCLQDNKWGVIDSNGNTVVDPSYAEMIVIPNSKNDVFLCTYDVNYETGEYKTKALNGKNEEIFTQYAQIEAIQNKDKNNNLWYENILKIKQGDKYGIMNFEGEELTICQYDEIVALEGIQNTLKVKKDGKYGIIDIEGKEILPTQYEQITNLGKDSKEGFIIQNEAGKYGIVDYSNNQVLEAKYDGIEKTHGNNQYVVKQGEKQVLVAKDGTEILKEGYDKIAEILKSTENGVIFVKGNKYGVMKLTGEVTIEANYEELKEAKSGLFIAKQNGKNGIIDLQINEKVAFNYESISYNEKADIYVATKADFSEDILNSNFEIKQTGILVELNEEKGYLALRQNDETKYYNFKFEEKNVKDIFTFNTLFLSKKDGKYGFVDKEGKVVVDYIYDDATEQNSCGYSAIKKDGKWGSIDNKGNIVQEPTYNLDEYLTIDFIGRWHLGMDINMNYYNQF